MQNFLKLMVLFSVVLTSCNNKPEFILLPNHSDTTEIRLVYLVSNPPTEMDSLNMLLVRFFIETQKEYLLKKNITKIKSMRFYEKNSTTSYFIDNADDPGGWSSEELSDYYAGSKKPKSGLGWIGVFICENDSTKHLYLYDNILLEYDKQRTILRDECTQGWYEANKHNELVRLFNENMSF